MEVGSVSNRGAAAQEQQKLVQARDAQKAKRQQSASTYEAQDRSQEVKAAQDDSKQNKEANESTLAVA